jgi:quaternary ammonium compound-resistance protein SugE
MSIGWLYLMIAGVCEVAWAISLKIFSQEPKVVPGIVTGVTMLLSTLFIALSVRHLPVGTAYAVWSGFGCVGVAIFGIFWFHEQPTPVRLISIGLIVLGIIGLNLTGPAT